MQSSHEIKCSTAIQDSTKTRLEPSQSQAHCFFLYSTTLTLHVIDTVDTLSTAIVQCDLAQIFMFVSECSRVKKTNYAYLHPFGHPVFPEFPLLSKRLRWFDGGLMSS